MTRKYHVRIRDAATGKLLLTFKGKVERKEQAKGRLAGEVDETLFVKGKPAITMNGKPKKKNAAILDRASVTTQDFGQSLKKIAIGYLESDDTHEYSIQSFLADIANSLVDMFDADANEGIETAKQIVNESMLLVEKLEDPELLGSNKT